MSNTLKAVLVIVVLVFIGYFVMQGSKEANAPTDTDSTGDQSTALVSDGSSNADLDQDLATLDAELNALVGDGESADASLEGASSADVVQ